ncbi:MAG: DUF1674 domain-containing protein [Alphaproteobacteria bacterium]|nr:DUF1674 domain-containing protein [Alphaproteobacteria bacterium]
MAAKGNHNDSPEQGRKKNPLYREHRLLPRKPGAAKTATQSPKEKKGSRLPGGAPQAETGGPDGPEPTRYGDWERKGRCVDF